MNDVDKCHGHPCVQRQYILIASRDVFRVRGYPGHAVCFEESFKIETHKVELAIAMDGLGQSCTRNCDTSTRFDFA
jgi:hypothetical protein